MKEDFLTSQKATNALSKMRTKACTLEELELSKDEIEELIDRKSTRLNSSHTSKSRMPSSA